MADCGGAVHVALGKDLKKGKMVLNWVFKNLPGMEIIIIHVHRPPRLIPMGMGGWFPINAVSPNEAEKYIQKKRAEMDNILCTFLNYCAKEKANAKKLVIEAEDVHKGIIYLAGKHQIKNIVLGSRSMKEKPGLGKGLLSCKIWSISNRKLVFFRAPLLPPISELNQRSSTSSSNDTQGSFDYLGDNMSKDGLDDVGVSDCITCRSSAGTSEETEDSDDDFIEFSLLEIEEAAAKWLMQNPQLGR